MKKLLFALIAIVAIACNKKENTESTQIATPVDFATQNEADIKKYISDHKLNAQKTESGLYYVINEPGTGKQPTETDNVTVAYKGSFLNGEVFDQSSEEGISFGLNQVIPGWTEGIPLLKEGGSGLLLIPSKLGYGDADNFKIPGGSVLVFEVKLLKVN